MIKSEPVLLLRYSQFLKEALKKTRVTEDEVMAVIRQEGYDNTHEIEAAILEASGKISNIPTGSCIDVQTLHLHHNLNKLIFVVIKIFISTWPIFNFQSMGDNK